MPRLQPRSVRVTLLLGALVTLAAFATDMGLPVVGSTAASFGVMPGRAALTLSVFLIGFEIAPLAAGVVYARLVRPAELRAAAAGGGPGRPVAAEQPRAA